MAQDMLEHLEAKNQALASGLLRVPNVAKIAKGLVDHLTYLCAEKRKELRTLAFGTPRVDGGKLKFEINFADAKTGREAPLHHWSKDWMRRKNLRVVKALDDNPRLMTLFARILEALESYARSKARALRTVDLGYVWITQDSVFVAEIKL